MVVVVSGQAASVVITNITKATNAAATDYVLGITNTASTGGTTRLIPLTAIINATATTNFYAANASVFGAGLGLGTTLTNIAFTPAVQVTVLAAGTYLIQGHINVNYAGATFPVARTLQVALQRTNSPSTVGTVKTIELPALTTFTGSQTVPILSKVQVASANDVYEIYADVSNQPSAGTITVDSAELIAVRLY